MIYLLTGVDATAKHLMASMLSKKINSLRVEHKNYIIEPDENDPSSIYSINDKNTNESLYFPDTEEIGIIKESEDEIVDNSYNTDIYNEVKTFLKTRTNALKAHTEERFYYSNSLLIDVNDDAETEHIAHNTLTLSNMINEINTLLETNTDIIYVSNITGSHLTDFKANFNGVEEIMVINIVRNPLYSFIMENYNMSELVVQKPLNAIIESYVRSLDADSIQVKYEDIISSNTLVLAGTSYTFRNIFGSTHNPYLTDYEYDLLSNITLSTTMLNYIDTFDAALKAFDTDPLTELEAGVCPSNILEYFEYPDITDLDPVR